MRSCTIPSFIHPSESFDSPKSPVPANGAPVELRNLDDYVTSNETQTESTDLDAPIVFVGYGITSPENKWDDYKGYDLRGKVADAVHRITRDRHIVPGLAVVLVGNNPASQSYVASKVKLTAGSGMRSFDHRLPETTSEAELLALVGRLNRDPTVHGILVQLPLPAQIDARNVIGAIDPAKDVDGFHPVNAGRLSAGLPALAPCTPLGCVHLARTVHPSLEGLEAVVIGRSNIVGKPLAQLLLAENATVTIAHSKTENLAAVCKRGDLVFAAVGRPEMVKGHWIKPGATVIDVGTTVVDGVLKGDVDFESAVKVAGAEETVVARFRALNANRRRAAVLDTSSAALLQSLNAEQKKGNDAELEAVIDRREYGLEWNAPLPKGGFALDNDVKLQVSLELVREA